MGILFSLGLMFDNLNHRGFSFSLAKIISSVILRLPTNVRISTNIQIFILIGKLMKQYEITFLTREEPKDKPEAPVVKEIEALAGKIVSTNKIGQKQLAYKIKKEKSAFYTTALFEIEPEKVLELNRKMGLKDDILRHLIIIGPKGGSAKIAPPAGKEKPKKKVEEVGPRPISPGLKKPALEVEQAPAIEKPVKPEPVKIATPVAEEKELDEVERQKALDKKLDELLKE